MMDVIHHLKKYHPMLRTLRTKGLAHRHWKAVASRLAIPLEPTSVTLHSLIMFDLHDPENLKVIKQVCEVATKEYAVQQQLAQLEREIKAVEFAFELLPDGVSLIVVELPELISQFDDYALRLEVLGTNPHVRSFADKLRDLVKIIEGTREQLNEWADLQRNYLYLFGIFALAEMRSQLESESRVFLHVKKLYDDSTQGFKENAQVYRITQKDNALGLLRKANGDCGEIRKGIRTFLEKKRGQFPRLFFLSDGELMDIFGRGSDLVAALLAGESQAFVSTLFEGVHRLRFDPATQAVTHLASKEGELVALEQEVATTCLVDTWLNRLEAEMVNTVKHYFFHAFRRQPVYLNPT